MMDAARKEGLRLSHDQYAYTASSTSLKQLLPDDILSGGPAMYARNIRDRERYAKTVEWMKTRLQARQREDYAYAVIAWHKKIRATMGSMWLRRPGYVMVRQAWITKSP